jgi:hypothetical protein
MEQVPVRHPTYLQYKKPPNAPIAAPIKRSLFFSIQLFIIEIKQQYKHGNIGNFR